MHFACYRETLTSLGPSFVKAGQVLASRPDIVREDYMNELCTLQDDVPSFPDDQVSFLCFKSAMTKCTRLHVHFALEQQAWAAFGYRGSFYDALRRRLLVLSL